VALVIVVICNCVTLYRKKGYVFMTNSGGVRMVFAGIVMALVLMFYQSVTPFGTSRTSQMLLALSGVGIGGIVYLLLLMNIGVMTEQEGAMFMKKEKLRKLLWRKRK